MTVGRDPEATRDLALQRRRAGRRRAGRRHGRRPHRQRGGDTGRSTGRPRPGRRDRQFDPRQGPCADHRAAAGRRRTVRHLEPRAGAARLADPGPWRAAAGLHQPRTGRSELAACGAGAGPPADGEGAGDPPCRAGAAAAGADPGDPQQLPRRRGPRGGPRTARLLDPRPGRLCRGAAAAAAIGPVGRLGGQATSVPRLDRRPTEPHFPMVERTSHGEDQYRSRSSSSRARTPASST